MKVILLESTRNAEHVVAKAAAQCYSSGFVGDNYETIKPSSDEALIERVIKMGHLSVLEHASFTFAIEGISRACSHQLVRFRHATFSQQSQRYCSFEDGAPYIIPPSILNIPELVDSYEEMMLEVQDFYSFLLKAGIPAEDARFVLPNATETKLVMTMNARELHHAFNLRCCVHAQWEIRALFDAILAVVKNICPVIFAKAGASCKKGYCPEGDRTCGKLKGGVQNEH